jgi:hypothetical protein
MREKTSSLVQTPDPRRWTAVLDISVSRHDSRGAASPKHLLPGTRSASRVRVVLPRVFVQLLTTTRSASPPGTPRHDPLVPVVCPAPPPDPLRPGHRAPAALGPRGQPTKKPPPRRRSPNREIPTRVPACHAPLLARHHLAHLPSPHPRALPSSCHICSALPREITPRDRNYTIGPPPRASGPPE